MLATFAFWLLGLSRSQKRFIQALFDAVCAALSLILVVGVLPFASLSGGGFMGGDPGPAVVGHGRAYRRICYRNGSSSPTAWALPRRRALRGHSGPSGGFFRLCPCRAPYLGRLSRPWPSPSFSNHSWGWLA